MQTKLFELRDKATFIPIIATLIDPLEFIGGKNGEAENFLMRRAGYGDPLILLGRLEGGEFTYDKYDHKGSVRTWQTAHDYIERHWLNLKSGDVICVETILGERTEPKTSERFDEVALIPSEF